MTVTAIYSPLEFPGANIIAPMPITWDFGEYSEVVVVEKDDATLAEVPRTAGVHYTIVRTVGSVGGIVTPLSAVSSGKTWLIRRATPRTQPDSLRLGGSFSESTVESMLDRNVRMMQEVEQTVGVGDELLRGDLSDPDPLRGDALVSVTQPYAGAALRTLHQKLTESISVQDFTGTTGDGVASDQIGFAAALELGAPVYVPYTGAHYALTSLTDAQRARLWGPGRVKVGGVDVNIASSPRSFADNTAARAAVKPSWQPAQWPSLAGSIGNGTVDDDCTRTGGFGTYGMALSRLHVTAAVPAGQFDVVSTNWGGGTNLAGGQLFAGWDGANTPSGYLGGVYSAGAVIGREINVGNRWADFGLQSDIGGTRYTVGLQLAPDVLPAKDGINAVAISSITVASPGVVNQTAHGYTAGMAVTFSGGTLPSPLVAGTAYYVSSNGLTANSYRLTASPGGPDINTAGGFAGPTTVTPAYPGSFAQVIGASVHGHRWHTGVLLRQNTLMPGGYALRLVGGAAASQAPEAAMLLSGSWNRGLALGAAFTTYGIDFAGATFGGGTVAPMNIPFTNNVITSVATGGFAIPNCAGFVGLTSVSGTRVYIPYYLAP